MSKYYIPKGTSVSPFAWESRPYNKWGVYLSAPKENVITVMDWYFTDEDILPLEDFAGIVDGNVPRKDNIYLFVKIPNADDLGFNAFSVLKSCVNVEA